MRATQTLGVPTVNDRDFLEIHLVENFKRLEKIEAKLDVLMDHKSKAESNAKIIAFIISAIVSVIISIVPNFFKR